MRWPSWDAFAQSCYETGAMAREMGMEPAPLELDGDDWWHLIAQGLSEPGWSLNSAKAAMFAVGASQGSFQIYGVTVRMKR
jgi:hypothetical protein